MTTQLTFNTATLSVINHNNQIWFSSTDLSKALHYKSQDSVTKIYNRNQDEFTSSMTQTVNLTASGNYQKTVRIFSLRGSHLIAMLSNTDVAKDFRKWLLDLADKEVGNTVTISKIEPDTITVSRMNLNCLVHHMIWLKNFYIENNLYDTFKALNSDFGVRMHDHIIDGYCVAYALQKDLHKSSLY